MRKILFLSLCMLFLFAGCSSEQEVPLEVEGEPVEETKGEDEDNGDDSAVSDDVMAPDETVEEALTLLVQEFTEPLLLKPYMVEEEHGKLEEIEEMHQWSEEENPGELEVMDEIYEELSKVHVDSNYNKENGKAYVEVELTVPDAEELFAPTEEMPTVDDVGTEELEKTIELREEDGEWKLVELPTLGAFSMN